MSDEPPTQTAEAKAQDGPAPDTAGDAAAKVTTDGPPATEEPPAAKVSDEPPATEAPSAQMTTDETPKEPPSAKMSDETPSPEPTKEVSDEPSATETSKESDEEPPAAPEPPAAEVSESEEGAAAPEPAKEPAKVAEEAKKPEKKKEEPPAKEPKKVAEEPKKKPDKKKRTKSEESVASISAARLQPRKVPVNTFKDVRPIVQKSLAELKYPFIKKLEKQAGMNREMLFYGALAAIAFYLMVGPGNVFLSGVIVKTYPIYQTLMAVHTQNRKDDTQWLAFWCAFAAFSLLDHLLSPIELVFGPYLVFKTVALLYLALPQTYGAHNLYVKYAHPLVGRLGKLKVN